MDLLSNAYLQWMCDNHPDYVRACLQKHRIGELDKLIWESVRPAWKFFDQREAEGKSYAEAIDLAMEALIPRENPEIGDQEEMSQEDQILVRKKLDAREEGKRSSWSYKKNDSANHVLPSCKRGTDLRVIQRLLGHASIMTTEIYTHVATKKLKTVHATTHQRA